MSLTSILQRRGRPRVDADTAATALAVADVESILVRPGTVEAVVRETLHRRGGPAGVRAELARRSDRDPARTRPLLAWARTVVTNVGWR